MKLEIAIFRISKLRNCLLMRILWRCPIWKLLRAEVLAIASAFGKAVIVTDVGELGQTISDGETGIVIKPGNEQALAGAILRLAADEALRSTLGNALRRAVADTVSAARIAAAAVKIYESIA